jgi:hypothetical protein
MTPWALVYGAVALSSRSKTRFRHHQVHGRDCKQAGEAAQRRLYAHPALILGRQSDRSASGGSDVAPDHRVEPAVRSGRLARARSQAPR